MIPLYKADDVFAFNNNRPVSLLCILSKVFEKIMYNRLIDFLETYKILVKFQFGFTKFHSTYMALMTLMDKLITALENGEHVIGIFLDFSKAFDTVDHEILLKKDVPLWYQRNSIQMVSELLIKPKTVCNLKWSMFFYKGCEMWDTPRINLGTDVVLNVYQWLMFHM